MPVMMPNTPSNPKAGFGEIFDQIQNPSNSLSKTAHPRTSILQTTSRRGSLYYNSHLANDHCDEAINSSDSYVAPIPSPHHQSGVVQVGRRDYKTVVPVMYEDQIKKVDAILKKPGNFNSLLKKHETPPKILRQRAFKSYESRLIETTSVDGDLYDENLPGNLPQVSITKTEESGSNYSEDSRKMNTMID
jgi:hypothetical protein